MPNLAARFQEQQEMVRDTVPLIDQLLKIMRKSLELC